MDILTPCPIIKEFSMVVFRLPAAEMKIGGVKAAGRFSLQLRPPGAFVYVIVGILAMVVVIDIDFNTGCDLRRLSVHDQKPGGSGCRCGDHFLKQGFPGFRVPDSHIDTFDELRLLLGRLQTRGVSDKGRCDGVKQTYCLSLALKHVRNIKLGDKSQSVLNYANLSIKSS